MASMTMDAFKCEEINFVLGWLQENGFERLKRVSEGKKNFVIPKCCSFQFVHGVVYLNSDFSQYVMYLNGNYKYM
jgi:hypothetical protein